MIDERQVYKQFHEALDVEPQTGAFDRLQAALAQRPVTSSRRARFVLPVPRVGLRLAAGLMVVVLTVAVAGAFLALHLTATRTTPAKPSTTILIGQLYDGYIRDVTPTVGWGRNASGFYRTTDGGATWQSATPPQLNGMASVRATYFLDADHAWIAAPSSGTVVAGYVPLTVFATEDGGRTWTAGAPVPAGDASGNVVDSNKLDFLDDRVGWLRTLTSSGAGQHTVKLYGTTDGGRTWHLISQAAASDGSILAKLGRGCYEDELKFVSVNLGWMSYDCIDAQGQSGSGSPAPGPEVAVTKDGGRSWHQVPLPRFSTGQSLCNTSAPIFYNLSRQILFVYCYNSSQVSGGVDASEFQNAIYVTSDSGLNWTLLPTPGGAVAFSDAENGWSMGISGDKRGIDMFRTSDGGLTWKLTGSFNGGRSNSLFHLEVFDSSIAIVNESVLGGPTVDWKTTDGGRTWVAVQTSSPPV